MGVDFVGKFKEIIGDEIVVDLYKINDKLGVYKFCFF